MGVLRTYASPEQTPASPEVSVASAPEAKVCPNGARPNPRVLLELGGCGVSACPSRHAGAFLDAQRSLGNRAVQRLVAGLPVIQRKCSCNGSCGSCKEEEELQRAGIQRKAAGQFDGIADSVQDITRYTGDGQPLDTSTRTFMESRFGQDFSGVHIHTDREANRWARDLNAHAFTTGQDVFFAPHKYAPSTIEGQKLLAHELTHVVQQRNSALLQRVAVGEAGDVFEQEADTVAEAIVRGKPVQVTRAASVVLVQRQACAHDRPATANCPESWGEALRISNLQHLVAGAGGGTVVKELYTFPNPVKGGERSGRIDVARIGVTPAGNKVNVTVQVGELKSANTGGDEPGGCAVATREAQGYVQEYLSHQSEVIAASRREGTNPGYTGLIRKVPSLEGQEFESFSAGLLPITDSLDVRFPNDPYNRSAKIQSNAQGGFSYRCAPTEAAAGPGPERVLANVGGNTVSIGFAENGDVLPESRYAVPGFKLQKVTRAGTGYTITAIVSERARIPFQKDRNTVYTLVVPANGGNMTLAEGGEIKLAFPFLSEASLPIRLEGGQMKASGKFRPTVPILRNVDVNLNIENEELNGGLSVPADKLKEALPVPGLSIEEANLAINVSKGKFSATGGFAVKYSTVADGRVEATLNDRGFSATGTLNLHIPGLDQATGRLWVREGTLGGSIEIGADKLKFPGVKSANLVVTIQDGQLGGAGTVMLSIPGVREGRLGFGIDQEGNYTITGTALLAIPGLDEATLGLAYRNGDMEGTGRVGFKIPGLEGAGAAFELKYARGALTGTGQFAYKKGRLSGNIIVSLSETHRLSGGGELAYEIAPGLVAFAGMQIKEDGTTKISGGLRVPETIDLFDRKQVEKTLFKVGIEIPILAIPLGTRSVGIVATIDARLVARAGIGPGQLRKVKILGEFDPSSDESAFKFQAAAELYVPAFAELALPVRGGIGVSLAIVRAVGGIEAEGAAGLQAEFIAATDLRYENGQFAVNGKAELSAQPKLIFRLRAFVAVEADLFVTTVEIYEEKWELAAFEWGSALRVGVRVPFHYVFGQPFELSLDQIEFIVPEINVMDMVKGMLPT